MIIESFLKELRAEGHLDSTSVFTLEPRQAARKMAVFQNAFPAYYLVRWVQAGVALGATEIRVKLGRRRVSVELAGVRLEEPLEPGSLPGVGQESLLAGIGAALPLDPVSLLLCSVGEEHSFTQHFTEEKPPFEGLPGLTLDLVRPKSRGLLATLVGDPRARATEEKELRRLAQACPVTLRAGGVINGFDVFALLPSVRRRRQF